MGRYLTLFVPLDVRRSQDNKERDLERDVDVSLATGFRDRKPYFIPKRISTYGCEVKIE